MPGLAKTTAASRGSRLLECGISPTRCTSSPATSTRRTPGSMSLTTRKTRCRSSPPRRSRRSTTSGTRQSSTPRWRAPSLPPASGMMRLRRASCSCFSAVSTRSRHRGRTSVVTSTCASWGIQVPRSRSFSNTYAHSCLEPCTPPERPRVRPVSQRQLSATRKLASLASKQGHLCLPTTPFAALTNSIRWTFRTRLPFTRQWNSRQYPSPKLGSKLRSMHGQRY
mmetsp:Transcript_37273/g.62661  ORF Transcript_37273/g.62661 Transcript_37273/m.62661 type:complete len:224 (+) Transcript_37273:331-1002(+)